GVLVAPGGGGGWAAKLCGGASAALIRHFFAYDPGFHGGLSVAAGDVDGDGKADVIVAPGAGGGPDVKVFSGASGALLRHFFAYDPGFTGGGFVGGAARGQPRPGGVFSPYLGAVPVRAGPPPPPLGLAGGRPRPPRPRAHR